MPELRGLSQRLGKITEAFLKNYQILSMDTFFSLDKTSLIIKVCLTIKSYSHGNYRNKQLSNF